MINHTQELLNTWFKQCDELEWILATIIGTEGSSYRKPGAMMMINSLGQYHGLLSGGCLESDIMRQSRQCWLSKKNRIIQYDMREEEDIAWQLGIGCGGLVRILLQPVDASNDHLKLHELRQLINKNKACKYTQLMNESIPDNNVFTLDTINTNNSNEAKLNASIKNESTIDEGIVDGGTISNTVENKQIFEHIIKPSLKLAVFGGGIDAIPVVNIAANLGWHVTVADSRTGYARQVQFSHAKTIIRIPFENTSEHLLWLKDIDAIVIMTHNVKLDTQALALAQNSSAKYVGMLGPKHRTARVIEELNVNVIKILANPIGLRLGGELPESIALSIISEIHAFFEQVDGQSISGILQ